MDSLFFFINTKKESTMSKSISNGLLSRILPGIRLTIPQKVYPYLLVMDAGEYEIVDNNPMNESMYIGQVFARGTLSHCRQMAKLRIYSQSKGGQFIKETKIKNL